MKRTVHCVLSAVLCAMFTSDPGTAAQSKTTPKRLSELNPAKSAAAVAAPAPEIQAEAKVVHYREKDVVKVNTKVRYTTLIVLPKTEQILEFTCGDKDFWIVNGNQNFAYVKPAKAGTETNLNLITASGNIYSFALTEISEIPNAQVDLKVFVEFDSQPMAEAASTPRFVSAQVAEDYRQQVEIAKEETRQTKQSSQAAIDSGITKFLANVRFPYRFEAGKKPFYIRAMYHDDKFTYLQARPEETPTLYEIKDGKPNLVNFTYKDGIYVVDKILDQGYLAIGKQKLGFSRQE